MTFSTTSNTFAKDRCGSPSRIAFACNSGRDFRQPRPISRPSIQCLCGIFFPLPPAMRIPLSWGGFMGVKHCRDACRHALPPASTRTRGRDHMPIEVEQQIVRWMRDLFGFPGSATGLFVTGSSMANLIGVLVARTFEGRLAPRYGARASLAVAWLRTPQQQRMGALQKRWICPALEPIWLRVIAVDDGQQMKLCALQQT